MADLSVGNQKIKVAVYSDCALVLEFPISGHNKHIGTIANQTEGYQANI